MTTKHDALDTALDRYEADADEIGHDLTDRERAAFRSGWFRGRTQLVIERGLADSAAGRTVDLGDFTQYAGTERMDAGSD